MGGGVHMHIYTGGDREGGGAGRQGGQEREAGREAHSVQDFIPDGP